jgi:peptide chain release factor 1
MFEEKSFIAKMAAIERRYEEVSALLGQPDVISKRNEFTKLSKEHSDLDELVAAWRQRVKLVAEVGEARGLIESESDAEMRAMAREELAALEDTLETLEQGIKILLLPKDPNDAKDILL